MRQRLWTARETAFLKTWWSILSVEEIAQRLRRTMASVRAKAQQLALEVPRPDWTPAERRRAITLLRNGASVQEVADVLDVPLAQAMLFREDLQENLKDGPRRLLRPGRIRGPIPVQEVFRT